MKTKMIVGLTGNIASGKSIVGGFLKKLGAAVIDADVISREVMLPGKPAYKKVVKEFSINMLDKNGYIDRAKLAKIVFSSPGKRKMLENAVHPAIVREILRQIPKQKGEIVVVEAPLLFESGFDKYTDIDIVVYAGKDICTKRLMKRSNLSRCDALKRINAQMSLSEKKKLADYTIDNTSTISKTKKQVENLWKTFLTLQH